MEWLCHLFPKLRYLWDLKERPLNMPGQQVWPEVTQWFPVCSPFSLSLQLQRLLRHFAVISASDFFLAEKTREHGTKGIILGFAMAGLWCHWLWSELKIQPKWKPSLQSSTFICLSGDRHKMHLLVLMTRHRRWKNSCWTVNNKIGKSCPRLLLLTSFLLSVHLFVQWL